MKKFAGLIALVTMLSVVSTTSAQPTAPFAGSNSSVNSGLVAAGVAAAIVAGILAVSLGQHNHHAH